MAERFKFNGAQFLQDNGMTLLAPEEGAPGRYRVEDAEGNQQIFDAASFMRDNKMSPATTDVEMNSASEAVAISPVTLADRARLALGNEAGKVNYLKSKFQEVKYQPDLNTVVVKNQGVWQQVDPEAWGEGNAWERSKEFLADLVDFGDVVPGLAAAGVGAAKGAAAGAAAGPVGALAGGAAGAALGGGGAEAIRTSLGRLAGTYSATPEEQIKDIGYEALLNMGGEFVGPAVKLVGKAPGMAALGTALKNIGSKASDVNKDIIAQSMGKLTGAGSIATRTAIDQTDEVVGHLNRARLGAKSVDDVVGRLKDEQFAEAWSMMEGAQGVLSRRYGELTNDLVNASGDFHKVDMAAVVNDSLDSLAQAGILQRKAVADSTGKVLSVKYLPMDETRAAALQSHNVPAQVMVPELQRKVMQITRSIEAMGKLGTAQGPEAAKRLLTLRKSINQIAEQVRTKDMPPAFDRVVTQMQQAVGGRVGGEFSKAGLAPQYAATSDLYKKFGDTVAEVTKMSGERNGPELFLNRIVSQANTNRTFKGFAQDLSDLYGKDGPGMLQSIYQKNAAERFSDYLPRSGLLPNVAGAARVATGDLTGAASVMAVMSPRASLRSVQLGNKTLDLLRGLNPQARAELLTNPNAMRTMLQVVSDASSQEDAATEALIQQATQGGQQ